jgi:hypothetical protein
VKKGRTKYKGRNSINEGEEGKGRKVKDGKDGKEGRKEWNTFCGLGPHFRLLDHGCET